MRAFSRDRKITLFTLLKRYRRETYTIELTIEFKKEKPIYSLNTHKLCNVFV